MGLITSKELLKRKIDEATSNSSLSNLRYIINTDKSKWKVFKKREVAPIPAYPATNFRPIKGCPCGNNGPCKQKVTPRGVTIHYPQKKKKFGKFTTSRNFIPPRARAVVNNNSRPIPKVKVIRQRKFPTWRLDKIYSR